MVEGAALGAAFELLFTSASDICFHFSSDLNRLNSTISFIKPVIHEIAALDRILDIPHHESEAFTAGLLQGEKLVRRCLEVPRWNVVLRVYYSMKIRKLEVSLISLFQVNAAALHFRESKRMAVAMQSLEEKVNEIIKVLNRMAVAMQSLEEKVNEIIKVLNMKNAGRNSSKVVDDSEKASPNHVVL